MAMMGDAAKLRERKRVTKKWKRSKDPEIIEAPFLGSNYRLRPITAACAECPRFAIASPVPCADVDRPRQLAYLLLATADYALSTWVDLVHCETPSSAVPAVGRWETAGCSRIALESRDGSKRSHARTL